MKKIFDKYIKEKPKSVEKKLPFYRWTTYLTTKQIEKFHIQKYGSKRRYN